MRISTTAARDRFLSSFADAAHFSERAAAACAAAAAFFGKTPEQVMADALAKFAADAAQRAHWVRLLP